MSDFDALYYSLWRQDLGFIPFALAAAAVAAGVYVREPQLLWLVLLAIVLHAVYWVGSTFPSLGVEWRRPESDAQRVFQIVGSTAMLSAFFGPPILAVWKRKAALSALAAWPMLAYVAMYNGLRFGGAL